MAETVHLYLKASGADIKGESTQKSLGREGSIECVYFEECVKTAREAGSSVATGRRQHEDILIRKRIDSSSPLILKALTGNSAIEATFKFFRPAPKGDGTTQQFYTIAIKEGRITSYRIVSPDVTAPASVALPPLEEIRISFHTIKWTYTDGGVEHEDTWDQGR
jgi:type VI secretion system secreted protein Hcp